MQESTHASGDIQDGGDSIGFAVGNLGWVVPLVSLGAFLVGRREEWLISRWGGQVWSNPAPTVSRASGPSPMALLLLGSWPPFLSLLQPLLFLNEGREDLGWLSPGCQSRFRETVQKAGSPGKKYSPL